MFNVYLVINISFTKESRRSEKKINNQDIERLINNNTKFENIGRTEYSGRIYLCESEKYTAVCSLQDYSTLNER